ncbi:hypothetical protein Tsubulata_023217 [Turnera subulata]|uniref:Glutamine amidotransferase type-2 domain-containing protein n=1 Tax=Turnera subulata TaxID=218843 RepID=A0A9Q0J7Y9_9ROSI|nr:hypothetical protein Tsubulata_023217 [Turnera subulata]
MCGIGLIVSGIRIDLSSVFPESPPPPPEPTDGEVVVTIQHLKTALERRGPDSSGIYDLFLHSTTTTTPKCNQQQQLLHASIVQQHSPNGLPNHHHPFAAQLHFIASTLQLRGLNPITQPFNDSSGNVLIYNGEIFGGIEVGTDCNDGQLLFQSLATTCSLSNTCSVPDVLSSIKGPWALIFWQACSKTLWFGRDAFGRRSLLVHWPSSEDPRFLLSSVSPFSSVDQTSGIYCLVQLNSLSFPPLFPHSLLITDQLTRTSFHIPDFQPPTKLSMFSTPSSLPSIALISAHHAAPLSRFNNGHSSPADFEVGNATSPNYWDELSCGIYSLSVGVSNPDGCIVGEVKRHEWANTMLMDLIKWERVSVQPKPEDLNVSACLTSSGQHQMHSASSDAMPFQSGIDAASKSLPAQSVLRALRKSVMLRTSFYSIFKAAASDGQEEDHVPVAVLFSGGLDSMILAALLDECLDPRYGVDLLNVSFDGANAPDRISAREGVEELKRVAPSRRWKLVEIDADLSKLTLEMKHVMSLINPANTYMDLNIGVALWLAARGDGWVFERTGNNSSESVERVRYKSKARIVLVGSGADEQCAGYGRHRTKYRSASWLGLNEEMKLDMQRIWKRNMGRDDRCIADNGKEGRFPFLDEDVIKNLLDFPLWEVANLEQPSGTGDKKILREENYQTVPQISHMPLTARLRKCSGYIKQLSCPKEQFSLVRELPGNPTEEISEVIVQQTKHLQGV